MLVREDEPAVWALRQEYTRPGRLDAHAHRLLRARARGGLRPGRIRPHERTHPGPKEDRLRLTRATRTNLSPIFSLFADRDGAAAARSRGRGRRALRGRGRPRGHAQHALARPTDEVDRRLQTALAGAELLIADGHHRYETARVYAEEVGGEGDTATC